jgi:hypothetical protein
MHTEPTTLNSLGTVGGAANVAAIGLVILLGYVLIRLFNVNVIGIGKKILQKIAKVVNKAIFVQERKYHRDLEIGRINDKSRRVIIYKFFNDLSIDLGLKRRGATPYELLLFIVVVSMFIGFVIGKMLLSSVLMAVIMTPIVFVALLCILYTKGNREHDSRIDAVIEAENIIANNIKDGVVVAVRNSIDLMPIKVRGEFRDFLDNIEHKNLHIRTALLELNNNLGSISNDFIKKCIVFEMEEEAGIVGMFRDIVEVNNIKTEMRNEMKRKFEEINSQFILGAFIIFIFLGGVLLVYPVVRNWYFTTTLGRIVLAIDCLLMIIMYVIITWLKAREL